MSQKTKTWLFIGIILIIAGSLLFSFVMQNLSWNFKALSTVKYEQVISEMPATFKEVSVCADTADVTILPHDKDVCRVEIYEDTRERFVVETHGDRLVVSPQETKKWYNNFDINFETSSFTIYLPLGEYNKLNVNLSTGDVKVSDNLKFQNINITTSTGDIYLENLSASSLNLTVSTGKVTLSDIKCKNLVSNGSTGKLIMEKVIVTEKMAVTRSTGQLHFESCDAAEIVIKTDTGDVSGSLLSDKVFTAKTDTGRISVPKTTTGGKCEITTDTGDIDITIKEKTP